MKSFLLIWIFLLLPLKLWASERSLLENERVQYWLQVFQRNKDNYFQDWLYKSEATLPKIKALLKRHGLPEDLSYLPLIESGLNAKAKSSANAIGYWQFMKPTAEAYGLKINWWLDERHDLIKSTWAAANYLKKLKRQFGDWHLALSAYNMGETRLQKLIQKHKTRDFWKLSLKKGFPKETKNYVPKFLAAALIVKNPEHFGFKRPPSTSPIRYTYKFVPGGTDLYDLAHKNQLSSQSLKTLNPELKRHYIPESVESHRIRIPKAAGKSFALSFSDKIR